MNMSEESRAAEPGVTESELLESAPLPAPTDPQDPSRRETVMMVAVDDPRASLLVVEVSARDLDPPLSFVVVGSSGTIAVPDGADRRVSVHVHDQDGFEQYTGEAVLSVRPADPFTPELPPTVSLGFDPMVGSTGVTGAIRATGGMPGPPS